MVRSAFAITRSSMRARLHASLMARLDRLGSAKEVAQTGAAIGRKFPHGSLLATVVRKSEAEVNSALDRLVAAGLLFRQGAPRRTNDAAITDRCVRRAFRWLKSPSAR
jgi:predicted ATPase